LAYPHGNRGGDQERSRANRSNQGRATGWREVTFGQPKAIEAETFGLLSHLQRGIKRLVRGLTFRVVTIHHQPNIHTRRPSISHPFR
jgi:hypothetical protein